MAAYITFKTPELIHQYLSVKDPLRDVVEWIAEDVWPSVLNQRFLVITGVWYQGRSMTHELYRALDLSARDYRTAEFISPHACRLAVAEINQHWKYGNTDKQVALYHQVAGGAPHFHIQVRPRETAVRIEGTIA